MSQTEDDLDKYRGTAGAEVKTADVSSDDNPLREVMGDEDRERIFDPQLSAERFVDFYDDSGAAIREALSNAETACVRRATNELLDAGVDRGDIPDETRELFEMAEDVTGYEPVIEITYRRKADDTRLVIEDNGIGISTEEYKVVQRVGYSASHMEGGQLGNFGIGWLSLFQLTSVNGTFKMSTKSYLTDESYSTMEYVANFEIMDNGLDEYGTRFAFPSFGEEAKSLDIRSEVSEYAEGMQVPVLYREFDESGDETSHSDDFLPRFMEDDYPDDSLVITYEDEFFKAVMSPDRKERNSGLTTYNISMPIRRNTDAIGTNPKFDARWSWDFRAKQEDGPIVHCESDESLVGISPIEDAKYKNLHDELKDDHIPLSEVPDDAVVMPKPASSRDSYKAGHDDFWKYVSQQLTDEWASVAKEHFKDLDSWDDFLDMDREEKNALFRAYGEFGPKYKNSEPDTIQETLRDSLGITLDKDVGKKIHESQGTVNIVRRGHNRAHTKKALRSRKIWKVIDEAPDGVYMGKTISQKKAEIVWGLGETHVVRLGSDDTYDELASSWDWEKAKELPHRNLSEKLPELDDDIAEKYENVSDSDSNNTRSTTGGDGKNPETYRLKVRVGSNSRKYYTTRRAKKLKEAMEDDDSVKAGRYTAEYIILKKDAATARQTGRTANRSKNIAATRVPKYVYEYLEGTDNIYESMDELMDDRAGVDVELSDGTVMNVQDLPETDFLIFASNRTEDLFEGRPYELVEILGYDSDEFERYTWCDSDALRGAWGASTDATVVRTGGSSLYGDFDDYSYKGTNYKKLLREDKLGDVDTSSEEYEALFGSRYGTPNTSTFETLIEIAAEAGLGDDQ